MGMGKDLIFDNNLNTLFPNCRNLWFEYYQEDGLGEEEIEQDKVKYRYALVLMIPMSVKEDFQWSVAYGVSFKYPMLVGNINT